MAAAVALMMRPELVAEQVVQRRGSRCRLVRTTHLGRR
jgi:hypothetical protein